MAEYKTACCCANAVISMTGWVPVPVKTWVWAWAGVVWLWVWECVPVVLDWDLPWASVKCVASINGGGRVNWGVELDVVGMVCWEESLGGACWITDADDDDGGGCAGCYGKKQHWYS